ncbi:MAG: hypothetical protein JWO53_1095 [Chlamydiia bacterium]|nr:hypothetical protein [Chlamydiia bacterium]
MNPINCKKLLCEIARREGELNLHESSHKAGPHIEKYLTVFRQAIYEISRKSRFLDLNQGYDWCCAFVYYCCQQAGYEIPIRTSSDERYTLAVVNNWIKYAIKQNLWKEKMDHLPRAGDLVIFDKLLSQDLADHIGIVLSCDHNKMLIETAEGNVKGATGVFIRPIDETIRGYVCLPR